MKSLYVASVAPFAGKTATCLGLAVHLQADGYKVGYLKPLSLQPFRIGDQIADEDAVFAKEILNFEAQPWDLSPVIVTPDFLRDHLASQSADLMERVKTACEAAGASQDILLLEGGSSLREGYLVGLPAAEVARAVGAQVLAVVCYQTEVQILDDILAARVRLGEALCGVIINRVPAEASSYVMQIAIPYLEQRGIAVFGVFPEAHGLAAVTVGEIIQVLEAEVLTKYLRSQTIVETLTVGAMTAETALSRFRQYSHKAVITGGDRTDIQLAALETSTTCLILTGNLRPSPLVVKQAEEFGVTVLLVRTNTLETVEAIERIFGKTHLGMASKMKQFQMMLDKNLDFERLYQAIGLEA